jgi:hypothetical protein
MSMHMRTACARNLQLGMQRSAGTGEKQYDGDKTWTEASRFRDYNPTINENRWGRKSIIVIARIRNNFRVIPLTRCNKWGEVGGRRGVRTPDPRIANAVLSQLS